MRRLIILLFILVSVSINAQKNIVPANPFLVKPYLQIGKNPSSTTLEVLWQSTNEQMDWKIDYKSSTGDKWIEQPVSNFSVLQTSNIAARRLYQAQLTGLKPGSTVIYRISANNKIVFTAVAHTAPAADQPYRFVAMGDIGAGTTDAKKIAGQALLANPAMVVVPGDIVYERGLISEYDKNFWPVYNADTVSASGAPLMRSIPFVSAPGNHDVEERNFNTYPDALAYFQFWDQPLNGPAAKEGGPAYPMLTASDSARQAFLSVAKDRFPVMTNFSFNYGNAHFLMLDADNYVDWTNTELVDWVRKDLKQASTAVWKFVVYHHPGFSSSREHFEQQQMRLLAPVLDSAGVDVVFNGHVHNFQRSYPMRFTPDRKGTLLIGGRDNKTIRGRVVNGRWVLDKQFDGDQHTAANGVIYVVTGAGGQELYNPEQNNDPDSWQKFTMKFKSTVHSFSVIDVQGKKFSMKQVDADGNTIDSFTITKE